MLKINEMPPLPIRSESCSLQFFVEAQECTTYRKNKAGLGPRAEHGSAAAAAGAVVTPGNHLVLFSSDLDIS